MIEESKQSDEHLKVIEREAATGRQLAGLATTIDGRRKDGAFDVFLCHNSQDKPAVRELARALGDLGLLAWIDEERLLPGDVVPEKLERALLRASCATWIAKHRSSTSRKTILVGLPFCNVTSISLATSFGRPGGTSHARWFSGPPSKAGYGFA